MNKTQVGQDAQEERWVDRLDEEDLAFLKRFVLASGSLKETAEAYGISYPTVRLRLDRLIEKIKVWDSREPMDEFERVLRAQYADGKLDLATLRVILAAHRKVTRRRPAGGVSSTPEAGSTPARALEEARAAEDARTRRTR